jgi:hypothetical protein
MMSLLAADGSYRTVSSHAGSRRRPFGEHGLRIAPGYDLDITHISVDSRWRGVCALHR